LRKTEVILPLKAFSSLDRNSPVPLYFQLAKILEQMILSSQLAPGDRLENEVSLCARLNVSRPTVRRSIEELVGQGLVVRRRGLGTQVVHGQVTRGMELTSLFDDLVRSGKKPTTKILSLESVPADATVALALGVAVGERVVFVHRLRGAGKTPVAVLQNWIHPRYSKLLEDGAELSHSGLYHWLRGQGASIQVAKQKIAARRASSEEAGLLEIDSNSPVLTMDRTAFDSTGEALEYGQHCYRTDLYSFEFTIVER
jgi:DNA-binding GntR family transcriptional regulator